MSETRFEGCFMQLIFADFVEQSQDPGFCQSVSGAGPLTIFSWQNEIVPFTQIAAGTF